MKHSSKESTRDIINIWHEQEVAVTFELNSGSVTEIQDLFYMLTFFSGRSQIEVARVQRSVLCYSSKVDTLFPIEQKQEKKKGGITQLQTAAAAYTHIETRMRFLLS
jgi:hypothetical protein